MARVVSGRRLSADGKPIEGTGFEYESDGPLAALLAQRVSPLFSQPFTGEWVFGVIAAEQTGGEYERGVGIFPSGNAGPPEHFHPIYDEHFDIVQGEFIFKLNGREQRAGAGDKLVATRGTAHTFRCVGPELGVIVVETRPAARIGLVISTLFGMAHEGKLTQAGQPKALHGMVIASEYADDTVMTSPPPSIVIPVAKLLAPVARLLGHRSGDSRYLEESFWRSHVEQP